MAETLLASLVRQSRTTGWAVSEDGLSGPWLRVMGVADELNRQARSLNLEPTPNRRGDPIVTELRPTPPAEARSASISAVVGLGEQPLHTDGAHLRDVPQYVVLWSDEPNNTPTRVWNPRTALRGLDTSGMFVVDPGSEPFLAMAGPYGSLRFDPGCMTPADSYARRIADALQNPPPSEVVEVHWDSPGKILLLCNRYVLHGRAKIAEGDTGRRVSRIAYRRRNR